MLSLAIRHLRYLPPAHQLIQICLAATRHAARKYRIPDAELKVSSDEPEIALVAGGNNDLLQLAGQLLDAELASPLAGGGPVGAGWSYFINDGLIRNYENVESADRFVEVQDALLSQYAQRMQPHMAVYPEVNGDLSDDGSLAQELGEEIFVVHGRGDERTEVAAEIGRLTGRPPIILEEQPDGGSPTIIEKLEREARRAGYAVVIFSGDDEGRLRGSDSSGASEPPLQPRARQNVVAELGYFMGKLGRQRVKVIYEPGVELPSDFGGLAYVASEPHTAEKAAR
jgi:predicted nucleotide-binding protein